LLICNKYVFLTDRDAQPNANMTDQKRKLKNLKKIKTLVYPIRVETA